MSAGQNLTDEMSEQVAQDEGVPLPEIRIVQAKHRQRHSCGLGWLVLGMEAAAKWTGLERQ